MTTEMEQDEPATLAAALAQTSPQVSSRKAAASPISDSEYARQQRIWAAWDAWREVARFTGRRYLPIVDGNPAGGVSLENFIAETEAQKSAAAELRNFCRQIEDHTRAGRGLLLIGPKGTGKDHLAISCLREAASAGFITLADDGQGLFQRFRDGISSESSERDAISRYTSPDVLLLSDPIPAGGIVSDYQRSILWRIVDRRYRDLRPTWATLNVIDSREAETKIGGQIVDRLKDGACVVKCVWESYRKVAQ